MEGARERVRRSWWPQKRLLRSNIVVILAPPSKLFSPPASHNIGSNFRRFVSTSNWWCVAHHTVITLSESAWIKGGVINQRRSSLIQSRCSSRTLAKNLINRVQTQKRSSASQKISTPDPPVSSVLYSFMFLCAAPYTFRSAAILEPRKSSLSH